MYMKFEAMPNSAPQAKVETKEKAPATPESVRALLRSEYKSFGDLFEYIKKSSDGTYAQKGWSDDPVERALIHTISCLRNIRARYYRGDTFTGYKGDDLKSITETRSGALISLAEVDEAYELGAELMATCAAVYYGEATYVKRKTGELLPEPVNFS